MNGIKIFSVTALSCLIGLLIGFGMTSIQHRQAAAEQINVRTIDDALARFGLDSTTSAPQVAVSAPGVGSSFVTEVYRDVSPAVVHITNRAVYYDYSMFFGPQEYEAEATGSGVIVDKSGYILTNNHVVEGANEIIVILNDGQEFVAEVIGADPGTDLALIKVDAPQDLPIAALGDSGKLEVGEWVIAIGNPRGLDWTVTAGVVSALGREIVAQRTGQTIRGLIQTDASINPGNSGGPLLNAAGEVIGINDAIISTSGGSQGIGLAIPINLAKDVLDDLVQHGRVIRPWLGVKTKQITPRMAAQFNLPVDYGVVILNVFEDSPAAGGGIIPYTSDRRTRQYQYDILVSVDDEKIDEDRELLDIIRGRNIGDRLKVDLYRIIDGDWDVVSKEVELSALPAEAPLMGII